MAASLAPAPARGPWLPHLPAEVRDYQRQTRLQSCLIYLKESSSVRVPRVPAPMAAPAFHQPTASLVSVPTGEPSGVQSELYSDNVTDGRGQGVTRERTSAAAPPV